MGDMGDFYNDLRQHRKEKRAAQSAKVPDRAAELTAAGYSVVQLSTSGPHLRINGMYDFWPSTGTWKKLRSHRRGTGMRSLMRELTEPSR